jgi:hypothetical protein
MFAFVVKIVPRLNIIPGVATEGDPIDKYIVTNKL